ncbi:MAG: mechanosensitive ion channel [Planctomycetaceae bacterium]|nr:mechanosensitive ion channel [Planctomycetaceae bacterium]
MNEWSVLAAETHAPGVLETVNTWGRDAQEFLMTRAADFGLRAVAALILYMIGRTIARVVIRIVRTAMERAKVEAMLVRFACNVLHAVMMAMVVIGSLQLMGVEMTSVTAIIATAGFAIGLALQGSLSNFASGIMLVIFKPFRVGQRVDVGGVSGTVEEIHLFTTIMRTGDNTQIIIPNGQITSGVICNYNALPTRRIDLVIGCGYADDLRAVKRYLLRVIQEDSRILKDPEPLVAVDELGNSSVNFVVRPWVKTEDFQTVRRDLLEKIKLGFDAEGFTIPYPSQDLYVHPDPVAASGLRVVDAA